jgi:hypothetical protein
MTTLSSNLAQEFESIRNQALQNAWPVYQIFGLKVTSDFPFGNRLPQGQGGMELVFTCRDTAPILINWDEIVPIYTSVYRTKNNKPVKYLYKQDDFFIIRYTDWVDFYILGEVIICHTLDKPLQDTHVINLLPNVLSFGLEMQGIPCLHAGAVVIDDYAVAFLAHSGHGKSSMTAAFLEAGYPLLTDDKLPIEQKDGDFFARPGYPLLRIYPAVAESLNVEYQDWDTVMPGFTKRVADLGREKRWKFCDSQKPLSCICILERLQADEQKPIVTISNMSPRDAVIELMRFNFNAQISSALGFSPARLDFFSRLVNAVPVKRVAYRTGLDNLPNIQRAILQDLQA